MLAALQHSNATHWSTMVGAETAARLIKSILYANAKYNNEPVAEDKNDQSLQQAKPPQQQGFSSINCYLRERNLNSIDGKTLSWRIKP